MFKKGILIDAVFGTLFIISLILLTQATRFLGEFSLLDPIGDAIGDVEMTDLVFSEIRENPKVDRNVVMVNIGNLSRREIAQELLIINQFEPAVIGIDSYFRRLKQDSIGDLLLNRALKNIKNLVLVSELQYNFQTDEYDSIQYSNPLFNIGHTGFANLETNALTQHQFKVCRSFPPKKKIKGNDELAFSVMVAKLYNAEKAKSFLERDNQSEIINYRGNVMDFGQSKFGGRFTALDVADVFERKFTPELIKGKIVLFGYMGQDFDDRSWEDKFYTPLNIKYAGRSNPDMFGVVVHANIISMILNEDYISEQSRLSSIVSGMVICFLTVLFFTWIYKRLPQWYDGLTKSLQLVGVFVILTINVMVFHWFNFKTNLTLATIMIALAGDSLEVCFGLVKNVFSKQGRKLIFKVYKDN